MPQVVAIYGAWVAAGYGAVAAAVITAAVVAANAWLYYTVFSFAFKILSPKQNVGSIRAQGLQVNVRDPAATRQIIHGQRKVSGVLYPVGVSGSNNEYLHLWLLIAGHECAELGDVYFGTTVVPLDGSGNATGKYAGYVRIKKHRGAYDETVDTDLQADLGSSYWTNDHIISGVAKLYVRLKVSQDLFPGGIPEIWCMVKGRTVYDSRDVDQSPTDYGSWLWSDNAALGLQDWLRGVPTQNAAGAIVRNYGLGTTDDEINTASAEEAANICDEIIFLTDSTSEPRYTANGMIATATLAGDGIDLFRTAMGGDCVYIGGQWHIRAGAYRTPTVTLTDSDLRAPLTGIIIKPSRRELCNGVKGVFLSPDNNWMPGDFVPVTNSLYTTEDGGERIWKDIELQLTTSGAMAQRLAKQILEDSRQAIQFTAKCKATAFRIQCTDVVMVDNARLGWVAKPFKVIGWSSVVENDANNQPYEGVDLQLRETASGVYDWADGEETTVDLAPNTLLPDVYTVPTPTSLTLLADDTTAFLQGDGTYVPRLEVSWDEAQDASVLQGGAVILEYKKSTDTDWIQWARLTGATAFDYITDVLTGVNYDVRIRFENAFRVRGNYATQSTYATPIKSFLPTAPSGLVRTAGSSTSYKGGQLMQGAIRAFCVQVTWNAISDKDFSHFDYTAASVGATQSSITAAWSGQTTVIPIAFYGQAIPSLAIELYVRSVDRTGNASAWVGSGSLASYWDYPAGSMMEQSSDDVTVTGISTGNGASVVKVVARYPVHIVVIATGGAPTEDFNLDLTGYGFSTRPDTGLLSTGNPAYGVEYWPGTAGNSSTNAVVTVYRRDGTNIGAGANFELTGEFTEID